MEKPPILAIVVPCYNEEECLENTSDVLIFVLKGLINKNKISQNSFVGFVDDGSLDKTWSIIETIQKKHKAIKALKLVGNRGHQNALLAGLHLFSHEADVLISIDADLQDDVSIMEEMILKFGEGNEIVYGVRGRRDYDSFFKKYTALCFYKIMILLGVSIVYNHADYRLISRRVADSLKEYKEENLFLRGIFPSMGYKSTNVYYDRRERKHGVSKYPLKRMFSFAWGGVTSFSIKPLRFVTFMGILVFFVSLILSAYYLYSKLFLSVIPGWASIVLPIYLLGGIQLLAIGIIGEYLGNIFKEVKRRPRYLIDKVL